MKHTYTLLVASAALASAALVAGCSDSGPGGGSGTLAFDYTGAASGHFNASGAVPLFGQTDRSWALGLRDDTQGSFSIAAIQRSTSTTYHLVAFQMPRITPGSETVDINCSTSTCPTLAIIFEIDDNTGDSGDICGLETGSLVLSTISESRATGSFSGTGSCVSNSGTSTDFTVTNGSFSVPVRNASGF